MFVKIVLIFNISRKPYVRWDTSPNTTNRTGGISCILPTLEAIYIPHWGNFSYKFLPHWGNFSCKIFPHWGILLNICRTALIFFQSVWLHHRGLHLWDWRTQKRKEADRGREERTNSKRWYRDRTRHRHPTLALRNELLKNSARPLSSISTFWLKWLLNTRHWNALGLCRGLLPCRLFLSLLQALHTHAEKRLFLDQISTFENLVLGFDSGNWRGAEVRIYGFWGADAPRSVSFHPRVGSISMLCWLKARH